MQNVALQKGCQQVLWLYGEQEEITEVGTMNLFIYWTNENGGRAGGGGSPPHTIQVNFDHLEPWRNDKHKRVNIHQPA